MDMGSRIVTTSVSEELWKKVKEKNISWARALGVGIETLLGGKHNYEELKEERNKLETRLTSVNNEIRAIEKKLREEKEIEEVAAKHKKILEKSVEVLGKDIGMLSGRTRLFNSTTGLKLTENDFMQLVRKYEDGLIA